MLNDLLLRLRALFFRRRMDDELQEELQFHMEMQARKQRQAGALDPAEAARQARVLFGSVARATEECRDARGILALETLARDVHYGLRILRKSPSYTIVAIVTLALGIGANVAVFGVLRGLILRPLNVPEVQSLWGTEYGSDTGFQSYPNYRDLRDRNRSFEDLAAFSFAFVGLETAQEAFRATGFVATGNYFDVLRIRPYLGRFFHSSDERGPNSAPYLVLSYPYWHSRFQDDPGVVGRTVRLNKHPFTIIGVAPPGFRGTLLFVSPDFFMPIVNQEQVEGVNLLEVRGTTHGLFEAFGHLKAGVTPAQALDDVKGVGAYLEKTYPREFDQKDIRLGRTGLTSFGGATQAFIGGLMLLAGLVLLAACANLGALFAARAADRSRELALRLALGSGPRRILQQLLTEAVLVSLAGGALGLYGGIVLLGKLSTWQPFPGAPIQLPVDPDATVYGVALVLALTSGLLFGLAPVRQVLKTDPYQVIKSSSLRPGWRRLTVGDLLLAGQIAICALLVTSSLVAVRGVIRSMHGDFGFEPRTAIMVNTNLTMGGYRADGLIPMQKRLIDAMKPIPGIERVGLVNNYPPLAYGAASSVNVFTVETTDLKASTAAAAPYHYEISPDYFDAAGTALLAGRDFTWHDDDHAPPVAIVNRELASRLFGSVPDAIGRFYKTQDGTRVQVVGVVENGKYLSLTEDQAPAVFLPFLRSPASQSWLVLRSKQDPQQLFPAIRGQLRIEDAGLPAGIETWNSLLDVVMFPARVAAMSLGVLGVMGAMLSLTGVFGMAAYSVSRRKRELGIRLAIGAPRKDVLRAALGRAVKLLTCGSVAGLVLGLLAARVLAAIVYQATPRDPLVLIGVVLAMTLLGVAATWIPAQRALSIDPVTLLRDE